MSDSPESPASDDLRSLRAILASMSTDNEGNDTTKKRPIPAQVNNYCESVELLEEKIFVAAEYRKYYLVARAPLMKRDETTSRMAYLKIINYLLEDMYTTERGVPRYLDLTVKFSNGIEVASGLHKTIKNAPCEGYGNFQRAILALPVDYFDGKLQLSLLVILESAMTETEVREFTLDAYVKVLLEEHKTGNRPMVENVEEKELWFKEHFVRHQRANLGTAKSASLIQLTEQLSKIAPNNKKLHIRLPLINDFDSKIPCQGELAEDCKCGRLHVSEYAKVVKVSEIDLDGFLARRWIFTLDKAFLEAADDKILLYCILANNLALSELDSHVSINTRAMFTFFHLTAKGYPISHIPYVVVRPDAMADILRIGSFKDRGLTGQFMVDVMLVEPGIEVDEASLSNKLQKAAVHMDKDFEEYALLCRQVLDTEKGSSDDTAAKPLTKAVAEQQSKKGLTLAVTERKENQHAYAIMDPNCFKKNSRLAKMAHKQSIDVLNGYDILNTSTRLETPKSKICTFSVNLKQDFLNDIVDQKQFISYVCYDIIKNNGNCYPARKKKRISIKLKIHGEIMQSITCAGPNWNPNVLQTDLFKKDWKKNVAQILLEVEYRLLN